MFKRFKLSRFWWFNHQENQMMSYITVMADSNADFCCKNLTFYVGYCCSHFQDIMRQNLNARVEVCKCINIHLLWLLLIFITKVFVNILLLQQGILWCKNSVLNCLFNSHVRLAELLLMSSGTSFFWLWLEKCFVVVHGSSEADYLWIGYLISSWSKAVFMKQING